MAKKGTKAQTTRFTFNSNQQIGLPAAESEKDFERKFIETAAYEGLVDIENPKCIVIGRTGSGKSALIRRIEETQQKVRRVSPEEMSLRFLSNSTILDYLRNIGVNLGFFYKVLWKHVFIVELINLYSGDSEQKRMTFFARLKEGITGEQKAKKEKALAYLQEFSNDFWEATEIRIKQFTNDLETNLSKELSISPSIFKGSVSEISKSIQKEESEVKYKAEHVINQIQAEKLFEIIKIFKEDVFSTYQRKYFIVVDDLDKEWVSPQIVYDLIAAMVEVVQEFQTQFKGVKIILSLRDNLHTLSISDNDHRGGQREKAAALDVHLKWKKDKLLELLNKRLHVLSSGRISTDNLFERSYKDEGISYIIDRTYMRPRALISFVNHIIQEADRKPQFSKNLVKDAERHFSAERLQAINDEWRENYGTVSKICDFLMGTTNNRQVDSIIENNFESVYFDDEILKNFRGRLLEICKLIREDKISFEIFRREVLYILFQVGIIGVKLSPEATLCFYYDQRETIKPHDFSCEAKISVHKALYSYFRVNTREQEEDRYTA